jgi:hypothetical protein
MLSKNEKLFEGTYQYFQQGQNYSQENFTVEHNEENGNMVFHAEIMSRVETGEFFKMQIHYLLNQFYVPQILTIEKSLGDRLAREAFEVDPAAQILRYTFKSGQSSHTVERPFSTTKHLLAAPCFVTSALFTMSKKIDTTARTPVHFVTPKTGWEFIGPPDDKIMWVDLKTHDTDELEVGGMPLTASQFELHDEDALSGNVTSGAQLWVSKHYAIPYQLEEKDGATVVIRRLKKLKHNLEKMF